MVIEKGTRWFRRFKKEAEAISPHIKFRRIKFGFYRIFWIGDGVSAYIGECSKFMPEIGYDIEEKNFQMEDQKYYEEYEDHAELIQKIKNFREGYWDSIDKLKTNIYMMKNNKDHRKEQQEAYKQMVVK
jgi:hypothetical protein